MKSRMLGLVACLAITLVLLFQGVLPQSALGASDWSNTGGAVAGYRVFCLAYDSAHNLLYGGTMRYHGVWVYDGATWKNTGGAIEGLNIDDLVYDSGHNLLYAATSWGVWKYSGGAWSKLPGGPSGAAVHRLAYDSRHNMLYSGLWIDGVWRYNGTTWTHILPSTSNLQDLEYDPTHNYLYAVDETGVLRWNGTSWFNTAIPAPNGRSLTYDTKHNALYAGSYKHGVWRYKGSTWTNTGGGMSSYAVESLEYDSSRDLLYAGTLSKKVRSYDGTTWTDTGGTFGDFDVPSIACDSTRGILYASALKGVYKYTVSSAQYTWYLAEGSTAWGFICSIGIMNPNSSDVRVKVTYMTDTGEVDGGTYRVPAMSAGFADPQEILGERDFSTKVECLEKKQIAVDRTMFFKSTPDSDVFEGHASVGVNAPASRWFLPEGSSAWGFECWLLIQNPNATEANCNVTYMIEGEGPKTVPHKVPARSRKTFNMATDIGSKDASIKVESNIPVIPERAMYRNNRREGHDSIGTTAAALDYYLAEGTTAWGFITYVLVQNPNSSATQVTVTYMTPSGPKMQPVFTMPANSRKTIRVNDVPGVSSTDLSTQVHGSNPIIAERAMYWGGGPDDGEACHDSIGMAEPHMSFYLPTGETGGDDDAETYTLVQNLNTSSVKVRLTYVTGNGRRNKQFEAIIPGQSRMTFNMADKVPAGGYGVIVESLTAGRPIMVERSMYYVGRGCGTDTIGGYSD